MNTESVLNRSRSARATRMSPDARRQMLLEAAIAVFAERGLGDVRHADLARAAAVAVPTTFHYFPSKGDLVNAVLDEVARFLLQGIVAPLAGGEAPAPLVIESILMTFCDAIDSHGDHVRVWLEWGVSRRQDVRARFQDFYRQSLRAIAAVVERGQGEGSIEASLEVDVAARVIVGLAHMIVQMKFSGSPRDEVVHTVHSLVHGYLVGHRQSLRP